MRHGQQITRDEVLRRRENGFGILVLGPGRQPSVHEPSTTNSSEIMVAENGVYSIRAVEDLVADPNGKSVHFIEDEDTQFFLSKIIRSQRITEGETFRMLDDGAGVILHSPTHGIFRYMPSETDNPQIVIVGDSKICYTRSVEALEATPDGKGVHFVENPQRSYIFGNRREID